MSSYITYEVHVYADGQKIWFLGNKLHNEAGPAVENADGYKAWYLDSVMYSESEHKAEMKRRNNTCNGKIVTIEGKQYELTEVTK
jgi:hypothetical protein